MAGRFYLACLALVMLACGRQASDSGAKSGTPASPIPAVENAEATGGSPSEAELAATLQDLTQAVRRYGVEQQRVPASLDELVEKGYLARVPPAPAGKRFAISKNLQVYVVDP